MMEILAGRLSEMPSGNRFVYKKGEHLYIRTGEDDFIKGKPLQTSLEGACAKWGFYKIENPPKFRDGQELMDNVDRFSLTQHRTIRFSPNPLR